MYNLTLKEKISQMFITGFEGITPDECFIRLLESGLGGVIFFTRNIKERNQFKNLIKELKAKARIPLFYSIDEEGGRVERTENIHNGKKYLSAKYAYEKGIEYLKQQTKEIALEIKSYGINMNFAPVMDVNTNNENPIIGERAFSNKSEDVIKCGKIVIKEYEKEGIISVCKHFPGHGAASKDSHKTLPIIDISEKELYEIHIKPFAEAIKAGCKAIMAAHVVYPALDETLTPASVSKKIITDILINKLGFNGVVMTDDMEMNGIKNYTRIEACIKAINAGVNMFIFRDTTYDILNLIDELEKAVYANIIDINKINISIDKIFKLKENFKIKNL